MDGPPTPRCGFDRRPRPAGFTLVELIMVVAMAALVVTVAVPAFQQIIARNRQSTHANQVVASLALARSHAVFRNRQAVLCPSLDGGSCADSYRWDQGWIVFEDADRDRERDAGERLLRVVQTLTGGRIFTSPGRRTITFRSSGAQAGTSGGSNATFTLCANGKSPKPAAVVLSNTGRARIVRPAPAKQAALCGDGY